MDNQTKSITRSELERLSELSKLGLSDSELSELERDMRSIMALMDTVKDIDAGELPRPQGISLGDLREDAVIPSMPRELLLDQHPNRSGPCPGDTFFTIPKIV